MSAVEPTSDALRSASAELIRLWGMRATITADRRLPGNSDARLHTVNGLSAHAYRLGETANHLIGRGLHVEVAPLVRTALECSVTAVWAAQVPDGVEAILNEDFRSRGHMVRTLVGSDGWNASGLPTPHLVDEPHESLSDAQARRFNQLCDDLSPGGAELYSYYKLLSWISHPTNYVMDLYAELVPAKHGQQLRLRQSPQMSNEDEYIFVLFCATSLVLAATAVDMLDADHAHRERIHALAEQVGCEPQLRLTQRALQRLKLA